MATCTALALMQAAAAAAGASTVFFKNRRHSNSTAGSLKSNVFLTQEKQSKKDKVFRYYSANYLRRHCGSLWLCISNSC